MLVIALGANLPGRYGSAENALRAAKAQLQRHGIDILKSSRIFKTAPVPVSGQPWYSNAVISVNTALSPHDLIAVLQAIENDMGRVRAEKNAPRIIDLDVIAYNDVVLNDADLVIPHPRMQDRAFVLQPLNDIAPGWLHPVSKKPLKTLLASLPHDQVAIPQWFTDQNIYLMGILNVTPDSFSDGGRHYADPLSHARHMLAQGADIIDIGGESTRPGAAPLSLADEQARVLPVLNALQGHVTSIDTRNAATMRAAIKAGVTMLNDVTALTHDPESLAVAASFDGPVCLMHMQGTPETMQKNPVYKDVVEDIYAWLEARIEVCINAGIDKGRLVADPGFGFGKTRDHNLALLEGFEGFQGLGVTLLAGLSRKTFLGPDKKPAERVEASVAAAMTAAQKGARILRVHDVAETRLGLCL